MKSLYLLPVILCFSFTAFGGNCRKGGRCGSGIPQFQSPFGNLAGGSSIANGDFNPNGLAGVSGLGGGPGSFDTPTFNGSTFNSAGARIQDRGGFLHVAGQPIFIGDNGEILVRDRVTGQLILADSNTTSQVLAMYENWAKRVEAGELPADSQFAIAQRALSGNLGGGVSGNLATPFSGGQNPLGGSQSPPIQQNPIDPSVTPDTGGSTPPAARNNPPSGGATEPQSPPTSPGSHTDSPNSPTEHPVAPVNTDEQQFNASIDKTKLRVFSDDKGNLFFTSPDGLGDNIFAGNSKLASQMKPMGYNGTSTQYKLSFEDSKFNTGNVEVDGEKMKLTCGSNTKDFSELKGDEAQKALEAVRFRPLPQIRTHNFLARTGPNEVIYVSGDKYQSDPKHHKLFLGKPGQLKEIPIKDYRVLRDGGSTSIDTEGGTFNFPVNGAPNFVPNVTGEPPVTMELLSPSKLKEEEVEKLIGKSLLQETTPQKLHTLCDSFEAP